MSGQQLEGPVAQDWSNVLKRPPHESTIGDRSSVGSGVELRGALEARIGCTVQFYDGQLYRTGILRAVYESPKDLVLRVVLEDRARACGIKQGDPVEYFLPFSALGGIGFIEPRPERPKS